MPIYILLVTLNFASVCFNYCFYAKYNLSSETDDFSAIYIHSSKYTCLQIFFQQEEGGTCTLIEKEIIL